MKKILYVDLFSGFGHTNLNKVYISRFKELGYELNYILKDGYDLELSINQESIIWLIPNRYFKTSLGAFGVRLNILKMLYLIKKKVSKSDYDCIFFSYFDEIAFSLIRLNSNIILMNHGNVTGLKSRLKLFCLKIVSQNAKILVFHESIKIQFIKYGINNVIVEPIGLIKNSSQNSVYKNTNLDTKVNQFKLRIFIPTLSKYDDDAFLKIILNKEFISFLNENNILFIIKSAIDNKNIENILFLDKYLSDDIYRYIFQNSDLVLLNYPESFQYKISASLFECFSYNKYMLLSDIKSFRYFQEHFNYNPFFKNIDELKERIINAKLFLNINHGCDIYKNLEILNPKLDSII